MTRQNFSKELGNIRVKPKIKIRAIPLKTATLASVKTAIEIVIGHRS